MGNCWSCTASESNEAPAPASVPAAPASSQVADRTTITPLYVGDDSSALGSDISGNKWFSVATSNFSSWVSQASGAVAAIWGEDKDFLPPVDGGGSNATDSQLKAFTFEHLKAATFNFRKDMLLGKGGFGSVYKGWLKENVPSQGIRKRRIAVKKLDSNSKQGLRQWQAEIGFLAKLSHSNIINLVGYCREHEELLIVYEFMEKGSLNYHLFAKRSDRLLTWEIRLKIAIGMARALSYLHMMEKPIIFRDFKTSNILLDESYTPKLSDFGLARWGPKDDASFITGHVMGTHGYAGPEYVNEGKLYVKSDVYSFGVVLVEMLTGLRAIDKKRSAGQTGLREWALPFLSDRRKLRLMMDLRLQGKYAPKQASEIALLAVRCLELKPQHRPSMKEVAETLDRIEAR